MHPIRVAVVGQARITRAGLRMLIEGEAGMQVVGETELLDDPATLLTGERPHVTLVDLDAGQRELGPNLIARLARKTLVITLTNASDPEVVSRVFLAGAKGLVRKDETPTVLLKAIRKVCEGEIWLDRSMTARLLGDLSRGTGENPAGMAKLERLTLRERQLATVVAQGFSNHEIAGQLHISEATVRNHLTSIFRKLELHGRFELAMYALQHDLIKPPLARARGPNRVKSAS